MNNKIFVTAPLLAGLVLLAGCGNTLNGARQDAANDTQAVGTAAQNAGAATRRDVAQVGSDVKQTAGDAKAESVLRPAVKTAIIRDPVLNDTRNQINVTADARTVYLRGHVTDPSMKQRATEDAQVVLDKHHSAAQISNELTVGGS